MSKNEKDHEFDPEKHKEIKKGPLKPEHKNQYGTSDGGKDQDEPKRAEPTKEEKGKK